MNYAEKQKKTDNQVMISLLYFTIGGVQEL